MGTVNATLLFAKINHHLGECNIFMADLFGGNSNWSSRAQRPGDLLPSLVQCAASFLLPGGLILTHPLVGATR